MKKLFSLLLLQLVFLASLSLAQNLPFSLEVREINNANVPDLQAYAFAQHGDYWLLMTGRTSGLHAFQPPFAFPVNGSNDKIYVVDVADDSLWEAPLSSLPISLQEQLAATNLQFYQDEDHLYLTGGYGFSPTANDYITFPYLTAVDVPGLISAIHSGQSMLGTYFRQISDQRFAVTGGRMEKLDSTYYLVFGQKFTGRYNPHNGPSFVQEYTNAIRTFQIQDNGQNLSITNYRETTDPINYHRRDYNLLPQYFAGGVEGMTAFTGVFQHSVDLPFLNSVHITAQGATVDNKFHQMLNQYHSAAMPMYDMAHDEMYSFFFGGISQYTVDPLGVLQVDSLVPFVDHISLIKRFYNDSLAEYVMPNRMPALLGSSAEFIPHPQAATFENGIIDYQALGNGPVLLGYIFGGIESDQPNIFMQSSGSSWATNRLFGVYLTKDNIQSLGPVKEPEMSLEFSLGPNPGDEFIDAKFSISASAHTTIFWQNAEGQILNERYFGKLGPGEYTQRFDLEGLPKGVYYLTLTSSQAQETRRLIRK